MKLPFLVFLDRDGTLIVEKHYLKDPEQVEFYPGVVDGLKRLQDEGAVLIIVTNQSGVARGFFDVNDVERVNRHIVRSLQEQEVTITNVYYCPHHPDDQCLCRKPEPGMLIRAGEASGLDMHAAFMVGDKMADVQAGKNAGTHTILLLTGYGKKELEAAGGDVAADYVAEDFSEAVEWILTKRKQQNET